MAGGKVQIPNPPRNAPKVNWQNLVQWEGPKKPKKQLGRRGGKEHEVKGDWERGVVSAILAEFLCYRGTKLSQNKHVPAVDYFAI